MVTRGTVVFHNGNDNSAYDAKKKKTYGREPFIQSFLTNHAELWYYIGSVSSTLVKYIRYAQPLYQARGVISHNTYTDLYIYNNKTFIKNLI